MLLTAKILLTLLVARGLVAAQDAPKVDGGDDLSYAIGLINQARQAQGLQPLAWNSDLAAYASFWANQMATGSVGFEHASGRFRPDQGETLYERRSSECDFAYDNPLSTAVNTWLAEGAAWDGSPVSSGQESWLHWSQCMWSETTHIGCARAFGASEPYSFFAVCRFYPQGNVIGRLPY